MVLNLKITPVHLVITGLVILIAILAITSFKGNKPSSSWQDKQAVLAAKDETIQVLKDEREHFIEDLEEKNVIITSLVTRDSVITSNYIQHQIIYPKLYDDLKKIPVRIAAIAGNDDSIRAAFARKD